VNSELRAMTVARALRLLDLEPGATPQQLREAYRDLVRVWHPDRFEADERLRQKATSRLSEINAAYRFLNAISPSPWPAGRASGTARTTTTRTVRPTWGTAAPPVQRRRSRSSRRSAAARARHVAANAGVAAVLFAAILFVAAPRLGWLVPQDLDGGAVSAGHAAGDAPSAGHGGAPQMPAPAVAATDRLPQPAARAVATPPAGAHTSIAVAAPIATSPFSRDLDRVLARASQ
jgi:hypothetical protein